MRREVQTPAVAGSIRNGSPIAHTLKQLPGAFHAEAVFYIRNASGIFQHPLARHQ